MLSFNEHLELCTVNQHTVTALLADYNNLFSEGLSKSVVGYKVHLQINPDAQHIFRRYYTIPLHLRDIVYKELVRLQSLEIVTPVDYSEWATPTVVIKKETTKFLSV